MYSIKLSRESRKMLGRFHKKQRVLKEKLFTNAVNKLIEEEFKKETFNPTRNCREGSYESLE